jgi:hypothetical protein
MAENINRQIVEAGWAMWYAHRLSLARSIHAWSHEALQNRMRRRPPSGARWSVARSARLSSRAIQNIRLAFARGAWVRSEHDWSIARADGGSIAEA